jgi:hypothetical protein
VFSWYEGACGSVVGYWFWGEGSAAEGEVLAYAGDVACVEGLALTRWFGTDGVSYAGCHGVLEGWRGKVCW